MTLTGWCRAGFQKPMKRSRDHKADRSVKRLEGLPRHSSMHAAGVVISKKSVDEYVPLSRAADGSITTQFTMTALEELGLLKMDFLGLRTLTVIQNAAEAAGRKEGREIDILKIDYNDRKVLDSIGTGNTEGVFPLGSAGIKSFMTTESDAELFDIIAGFSCTVRVPWTVFHWICRQK